MSGRAMLAPMGMRGAALLLVGTVAAAAAWVSPMGCLVQLDRAMVCGDGYVDALAGEQCDPLDPARAHESACANIDMPGGTAACDPESCRVLADVVQCSVCGDGIATGAEECDGADLRGSICPAGDAGISCKSDCTLDASLCDTCGNGKLDPAFEECERKIVCDGDEDCPAGVCDLELGRCVSGGIAFTFPCSDLDPPAGTHAEYSSGSVSPGQCTDACLFDRSTCGFCGNGVLDGAYYDVGPDGSYVMFAAEICDGDSVRKDALEDFCADACTEGSGTTLHLRCETVCAGACKALALPPPGGSLEQALGCCVKGGEKCDAAFPCCFALDNPDEAEEACQVLETDEGIVLGHYCRSK